jgi:hypothetical protein
MHHHPRLFDAVIKVREEYYSLRVLETPHIGRFSSYAKKSTMKAPGGPEGDSMTDSRICGR